MGCGSANNQIVPIVVPGPIIAIPAAPAPVMVRRWQLRNYLDQIYQIPAVALDATVTPAQQLDRLNDNTRADYNAARAAIGLGRREQALTALFNAHPYDGIPSDVPGERLRHQAAIGFGDVANPGSCHFVSAALARYLANYRTQATMLQNFAGGTHAFVIIEIPLPPAPPPRVRYIVDGTWKQYRAQLGVTLPATRPGILIGTPAQILVQLGNWAPRRTARA